MSTGISEGNNIPKLCTICRHSLAFRKSKTSDFFDTKYGGFAPKVRRFLSKKSDVFVFRYAPYSIVETASVSPSTKKVFGKKPTFPTPMPRTCCIYRQFRVKMVLKSFADVPKILRKSPYLALKTPKCVLEPVRSFVKII